MQNKNNNKEDGKQKIEFKTLNVFGPRIGYVQLPKDVVARMMTITKDAIEDKEKVKRNLSGVIREQIIIPIDILKKDNTYNILNSLQEVYVSGFLKRKVVSQIKEMWFNRQYENDYLPAHYHDTCTLSSVLYLKTPTYTPRTKDDKKHSDGCIVFMNNNNSSPEYSLENATYSFRPSVGDFFIWPSRLLHCVYPFKGKGERRSVSFNGIHKIMPDEKTH